MAELPSSSPVQSPSSLRSTPTFYRLLSRSKSHAAVPLATEENGVVTVVDVNGKKKQIKVFDRLKKFGKIKKGQRGVKESVILPPDMSLIVEVAAEEVTPPADEPSTANPTDADATPTQPDELPPDAAPYSAATLARRIQSLISSVPPFYNTLFTLNSSSSENSSSTPAQPQPRIPDDQLLSLLSSTSAMNGENLALRPSGSSWLPSGSALPSSKLHPRTVFSLLDRLFPVSNSTAISNVDDATEVEGSVMLYAPLNPIPGDNDSIVELADSQLVTVDVTDTTATYSTGGVGGIVMGVVNSLWPERAKTVNLAAETTVTTTKSQKTVRIWIPSKTKVSLQCSWWGFRIYLPPPVLAVLNDKELKAAKRAAMITTVLQWIVTEVPTAGLPPPLLVVVTLLKGLVPILGYLAGFIAWSWTAIKGFDKGSGVVLSATWILPIALIPSSWEDEVPPTPATPNTPTS